MQVPPGDYTQMMQIWMQQQQQMQARMMAEQTVAASPAAAAAAAAAAPAVTPLPFTPEQMQAYMAQQQAYIMATMRTMAAQQQQAQWMEQQQTQQQMQANKSKPAKRAAGADATSPNKKQKPMAANTGPAATAASPVARVPTASETAYQQQQRLLQQMEKNRQQQLHASDSSSKPKSKLSASDSAKTKAAEELLAKQKHEEALDDLVLFPRVSIKKLIKSALPVKEPVERSATRAINQAAVEFCNLVTSEANHIRLQEKHMRTQISIRHTVHSAEKMEAKMAARQAAAGSGMPTDPVEEAKDNAFAHAESLVMSTLGSKLSEPVLPESGRDDFASGGRAEPGDGCVLTGHHILAALVRLGFSQYARIAGSFLVNQVLLPNEQINESIKQNRRDGAIMLREQWKMSDAIHEHQLHIPSDPAAPENCVTVPGSAPQPSDVLHTTQAWQTVFAGDADRAASGYAEESRRSLQQWMSNNENLPSTPLYPNHPITQPGYKPIPCPLKSNCIHVLEAQGGADARRGSPHKAAVSGHGHAHRLPAAIGGVARKKAPGKPSSDRSSDAKDPPVHMSVAKGEVKKQPKRSSAAKAATNPTSHADELGPPKAPRRAAAEGMAAAAGEPRDDAKPAEEAPISTGIVDEGEHEDEAPQQQPQQQTAETHAANPTEASVEGRAAVDADPATHS